MNMKTFLITFMVISVGSCFGTVRLQSQATNQWPDCPAKPDYSWVDKLEPLSFAGSNLLQNISNYVDNLVKTQHFGVRPDEPPFAPGLTVTIQTSEGLFEKAYGYDDAALQTPLKVNARMQIGSNTKMFTGVLLMQLVEESLVTLEDKFANYFPELASNLPNGDVVTLRELATHNSGIPDYADNLHWIPETSGSTRKLVANYTSEEGVQRVTGDPPDFPAGTCEHWSYSSTGFVMLGMVVEKVRGQPLSQLFSEKIFKPLDLKDTIYLTSIPKANEMDTHGYFWNIFDEEYLLTDTTRWNAGQAGAAGSIVSTGRDMVKFAKSLPNGDLFIKGKSTFGEMTKFYRSSASMHGFSGYGMGIAEASYPGLYTHGGMTLGFISQFIFAPKPDFQVYMAWNTAPTAYTEEELNPKYFARFFPENIK